MRGPVRAGLLGSALALVALAGCEDAGVTTPSPIQRELVVHAVLNGDAAEQVVLVERTRIGSPLDGVGPYDADDPIASRGGDPVSAARVELHSPDGAMVVAVEDAARRADGRGAGVYRVATAGDARATPGLPALRLVRGGRYRLVVQTMAGTVRGETTFPGGDVAPDTVVHPPHDVTIDRRREVTTLGGHLGDTELRLVTGGAGEAILVRGSATLFLQGDRIHVRVDPAAPPLPQVPGLSSRSQVVDVCRPHEIRVALVDSNYRNHVVRSTVEDPFTADRRRSGVTGGRGVFAALGTERVVRVRTFEGSDVASEPNTPVSGEWHLVGGGPPTSVCLYARRRVRSLGLPKQWWAELSGVLRTDGGNLLEAGAAPLRGFFDREEIRFTVELPGGHAFEGPSVSLFEFAGTMRGDTLVGVASPPGQSVRFVRVP